jgi:hypothetical protein
MPLINNDTKLRHKFGISDDQLHSIKCYLQGAVYCWVKNRKDEIFAARDLVGGENWDWKGTPLYCLYEKHYHAGKNDAAAIDEAGKDLGWILKSVLSEDKRRFETHEKGLTKDYRWTGGEA